MMFLEVINVTLANEHTREEGTRSELYSLAGNVAYGLNCSTLMRCCYNCMIYLAYTHVS